MVIWVEFDGENIQFLKAVAGGAKGGIYIDGIPVEPESLRSVVSNMASQGVIPVVRVKAALGMKKDMGGLAIIYGRKRVKSKVDSKTLHIVPNEDDEKDRDKAVEKVLEFYKVQKIPSPL